MNSRIFLIATALFIFVTTGFALTAMESDMRKNWNGADMGAELRRQILEQDR